MIGFVVLGLVVGAVARLVVRGRQHLGLGMTLLLGLLGYANRKLREEVAWLRARPS